MGDPLHHPPHHHPQEVGRRRGCVGSGFGCMSPLLAGVLGCVCAGVGALLAPRHSWLGCAPWVCVFGLGFRLRLATPGWGVGVCVCRCACFPFTPPLLAGTCGVVVCVSARVGAAPRHSRLGCSGVCVLVCVLLLYPASPAFKKDAAKITITRHLPHTTHVYELTAPNLLVTRRRHDERWTIQAEGAAATTLYTWATRGGLPHPTLHHAPSWPTPFHTADRPDKEPKHTGMHTPAQEAQHRHDARRKACILHDDHTIPRISAPPPECQMPQTTARSQASSRTA